MKELLALWPSEVTIEFTVAPRKKEEEEKKRCGRAHHF